MLITDPPNFYKVHLLVNENGVCKKKCSRDSIFLGLSEKQAIHMWAKTYKLDIATIHQNQNGEWELDDHKIVIEEVKASKEIDVTKIWYG